ncbi:MAG: GAF and ANTAR domain-containing protein [Ilumatobacteraceae bacterium]
MPVLEEDTNLGGALGRIAELGQQAVPACMAASVTVLQRGRRAVTVGPSNDVASRLDEAQYAAGDGPCVAAARDHQTTLIEDTASETRWPHFVTASEDAGVRSVLSLPLSLQSPSTVGGSFNLYGVERAAFGPQEVEISTASAGQVATLVRNAQAYWTAIEVAHNMANAMENRAVIEQAKGVLMRDLGVGADEAFDELRRRSQAENRKLHQVAVDVTRAARTP